MAKTSKIQRPSRFDLIRARMAVFVAGGRSRLSSVAAFLGGLLAGRIGSLDRKYEGVLDPANPRSYVEAAMSWAAIGLDYSGNSMARPGVKIGVRLRGSNDDPKDYKVGRGEVGPQDLLTKPLGGEISNAYDFRMWIDQSAHMFGRAIVEIVRQNPKDRTSRVVGLRPLPAPRLSERMEAGRVTGFFYVLGTESRSIAIEDVFIFANGINPTAPGWGKSTFDRFSDAIDLRTFVALAQNSWFRNGCDEGGVLKIPGSEQAWEKTIETSADGIERELDSKVTQFYKWIIEQGSGAARAGLPRVITTDMEWDRNEKVRDVGYTQAKIESRTEILAGFGLSATLVGVDEGGDTNVLKQRRINYQRNVLGPRLAGWCRQMAALFDLLYPLDPAYEWAIIPENIVDIDVESELQQFTAEGGGKGTAFTTATIRMWMKRHGYTDADIAKVKDPNGVLDAIFVRQGWIPITESLVPTSQAFQFSPAQNSAGPMPRQLAAAPEADPVRVAKAPRRVLRRSARPRPIVSRAKFAGLNAATALAFQEAAHPLVAARGVSILERFQNQGISGVQHFMRTTRDNFAKELADATLSARRDGWKAIAELTASGLKTEIAWKESGIGDPMEISLSWLNDLLFGSTSFLTAGFDAATQAEIEDIVRASAEEGGTRADQAAELFDYWDGQVEKWRLRRDIETESNAAQANASLRIVRDSGVETRKTWMAAKDSRVRETHRQADLDYAEGIPLDEKFHVGDSDMDAPGDPAGADEERYNCRCCPGYVAA